MKKFNLPSANMFPKFIFTITFTLLCITKGWGQVSTTYSFAASSGTYTSITGGTNYDNFTNWTNNAYTGTLPNTTNGFLDDAVSSALLPIGFNFTYNNTVYTQFGICTNGWISLGALPSTSVAPLSTGTSNNIISALGIDLIGRGSLLANRSSGSNVITITSNNISQISIGDKVSGTGIPNGATVTAKTSTTVTISANATSNGTGFHFRFTRSGFGIRYQTIGTSPNRTLIVQWTGWQRYTTSGAFGELYNFQIRLNETTNTISFVYNFTGPTSTTAATFQIGLRGSSSTDFNNRTSTTSWSSTTAGTSNTSTIRLTNTIKPTSGQTYTWTPIPPQYATSWISANTGSSWWCQGETRQITVTVKNNGAAAWIDNGTDDYNIGVKWNADANYTKVDAQNLATGATRTYTFTMTAPTAGLNNLTFDVVKEGQFWFSSNTNGAGPGNTTYSQIANVNNTYPTVDAGNNVLTCQGSEVILNGTSPNIDPSFTGTNSSSATIPDYVSSVGTLDKTITVSGTGANANQITSVVLNIIHTYDSDLDLILIAPNGSAIYLSSANGGSGDNYTNTVFSTTGTAITSGAAPFTGTYVPQQAFSNLTGVADGTWILRMQDWVGGDVGTFNSWGITFTLNTIPSTISWTGPSSFTANTLTATIPSVIVGTNNYIISSTYRSCTSTDIIEIEGKPTPTATVSGTTTVCQGSSQPNITFTNPLSLPITVTYNINGGSNQILNLNSNTNSTIPVSTTTGGTYTYNLVNVAYQGIPNCSVNISGSATITVDAIQILSEPQSTLSLCKGQPLELTVLATGSSLSYQWYKNGSLINNIDNPSSESPSLLVDNVILTDAGTYRLDITTLCGYPLSSSNINVTIKDSPTAEASVSNSIFCEGSTVNFSGSTDIGNSFNWTGPNFSSSQQSPTLTNVSFIDEGTYTFTVTLDGCSSSSSVDIEINPTPSSLSITPTSITRCSNASANLLTATGGAATFTRKLGVNTTITATSGITPFTVTNEGARIQYLITNSELASLGLSPGASITSVAFKVMSQGNYPQTNFTIKIAQTLNSNLTNGYTTSIVGQFETVYTSGQESAPSVGWKVYQFTNSFLWSGYYNIVIEVCYENDNMSNFCNNCYGSQNSAVEFSQTSFNSVYGTYDNNTDMCSNTGNNVVSSKWRPNMKLGLYSPTLVTWSPFTGLYTNAAATQAYAGGVTNTVYTKATSTTVYTASAGGCIASAQVPVNVITTPGIPGPISGSTTVCAFSSATYSISSMYDATSYSWIVPSGMTIQSGQNTTSITVSVGGTFTSGTVSVASVNNCGTGQPSVLTVNSTGVNALSAPTRITGTTNVCTLYPTTPNVDGYSNNVLYSSSTVAGATTYNWRVPSNVRIYAGQGTRNVLLQFGPNFTSGIIEVRVGNSCGIYSSYKTLTVTKTPPVPGAITGSTCVTTGISTTYSISPVTGATAYQWGIPMNSTGSASGTSISVTFTSSFTSGNVQVSAITNCGTSTPRTLMVTSCGGGISAKLVNQIKEVSLYPNPTDGNFIIEYISDDLTQVLIEIFDTNGKLVTSENHLTNKGLNKISNNLKDTESGLYSIRITDIKFGNTVIKSVIKQK